MKKALVVGGNSGIGLALVVNLLEREYDHVYIVGKSDPDLDDILDKYKREFLDKTTFYKLGQKIRFHKVTDTNRA